MPRFFGLTVIRSKLLATLAYVLGMSVLYVMLVLWLVPTGSYASLDLVGGLAVVSVLAAIAGRFPDFGLACLIGILIGSPTAASVASDQGPGISLVSMVLASIVLGTPAAVKYLPGLLERRESPVLN